MRKEGGFLVLHPWVGGVLFLGKELLQLVPKNCLLLLRLTFDRPLSRICQNPTTSWSATFLGSYHRFHVCISVMTCQTSSAYSASLKDVWTMKSHLSKIKEFRTYAIAIDFVCSFGATRISFDLASQVESHNFSMQLIMMMFRWRLKPDICWFTYAWRQPPLRLG